MPDTQPCHVCGQTAPVNGRKLGEHNNEHGEPCSNRSKHGRMLTKWERDYRRIIEKRNAKK